MMIPAGHSVYQLQCVTKDWTDSGSTFRVSIPDLVINQGEIVAVIGTSGCGKSTLLEMLAMTLSPTSAEQFFFYRRTRPASMYAMLGGMVNTILLISRAGSTLAMSCKQGDFCHF